MCNKCVTNWVTNALQVRYKLGNKGVTYWVTNGLQMRYKLGNKWVTKKTPVLET